MSEVMGTGRMHRCVDKTCFMFNELQSTPVEISVLRKLITYTKDKVVQNTVSYRIPAKSGLE